MVFDSRRSVFRLFMAVAFLLVVGCVFGWFTFSCFSMAFTFFPFLLKKGTKKSRWSGQFLKKKKRHFTIRAFTDKFHTNIANFKYVIIHSPQSFTRNEGTNIKTGLQRSLPVNTFECLNFKKLFLEITRTMQKQFPVNWLTSGRLAFMIQCV